MAQIDNRLNPQEPIEDDKERLNKEENPFNTDFPKSDIEDINSSDYDDELPLDAWEDDVKLMSGASMREAVDALEENEDEVECKVCFELGPKAEMKKLDIGYVCPKCVQEMQSHQGTNLDLIDSDPFSLDYEDPRDFDEPEEDEVKEEPVDANEIRKHEEGIEEDLKVITDFSDYKPWSGAIDTYALIEDAHKLDDLEAYLEELYPDGITATQINDILWFDGEQILKDLGITDDDEVDESLTEDVLSKFIPPHPKAYAIINKVYGNDQGFRIYVRETGELDLHANGQVYNKIEKAYQETQHQSKNSDYSEVHLRIVKTNQDLLIFKDGQKTLDKIVETAKNLDVTATGKRGTLDDAKALRAELKGVLETLYKEEATKYDEAGQAKIKEIIEAKFSELSKLGTADELLQLKNGDKLKNDTKAEIDALGLTPKATDTGTSEAEGEHKAEGESSESETAETEKPKKPKNEKAVRSTKIRKVLKDLGVTEDKLTKENVAKVRKYLFGESYDVTNALIEAYADIPFDSDVQVGDTIRIIHLAEEDNSYDGKVGTVEHIDGIGQLHGTWGGLAVIPGVDEFEVIANEGLIESLNKEALDRLENYVKENGLKYEGEYEEEGRNGPSFYVDDISYLIEYKDNKYNLGMSIYHASEDNNAEYPDSHTDEVDEVYDTIEEIYEEHPQVIEELYKVFEDKFESLNEHVNDRPANIESDQELQGTDNAVVDCKKYTLVAHSEDEKPVDCKLEKPALEEPLAGEKVDAKLYEDTVDASLSKFNKAGGRPFTAREEEILQIAEDGDNTYDWAVYGAINSLIKGKVKAADETEAQKIATKIVEQTGAKAEKIEVKKLNDGEFEVSIYNIKGNASLFDSLEEPVADDGLKEAKKDDELPVDPEAAKLEVHTMLNDLVADEIEAINGYEEAKKEILDAPISHKDTILDTVDHIEDEEKEHIDELIDATTEIPFDKEEAPIIEETPVEEPIEENPLDQEFPEVEEDLEEAVAKPEADKTITYNKGLALAHETGKPVIYGYTNKSYDGKFFALDDMIACDNVSDCTKTFKQQYKSAGTVYVAYPNGSFVESLLEDDEEGKEIDYVEYKHSYCRAIEPHLSELKNIDDIEELKKAILDIINGGEVKFTKKERKFAAIVRHKKWKSVEDLKAYLDNSMAKAKEIKVKVDDNGELIKPLNEDFDDEIHYDEDGDELFTPEEQEEFDCDEWGYSNNGYDQYHHCGWCKEIWPESDMRHEVDFGWICSRCEDELKYHGGPLTFIENESLEKDTENKE